MANRRMFSNKIVMSAKFLKMPSSSQALYFHLALNADDDGVVEAFSIMRIVGSAADDLKILIAKGFIIQLNEDEVCFIVDWLEHNQIRADRKVDSIYHDLLVQTVGNIKLIEAKPRADRSPKDGDGTSQGQRMGGVGKDSIDKNSIGKDKKQNNASDDADSVSEIYKLFNEINGTNNSNDKKITIGLQKILKERSFDEVKLVIEYMANGETYQWYRENGHNTLSKLAEHTKFYEKLEKAQAWERNRPDEVNYLAGIDEAIEYQLKQMALKDGK